MQKMINPVNEVNVGWTELLVGQNRGRKGVGRGFGTVCFECSPHLHEICICLLVFKYRLAGFKWDL